MVRSRSSLRFLAIALLVAIVALVVGCYPEHNQSTFDPAGKIARDQLTLFYWIFWAAVVVFVVVEGALVYSVIRFRRKPGQGVPAQVHGNTRLEVAWTIAPAIVLAVVAVPTLTTIFDHANAPADAMEINVIGHRWWWEFQYPDEDPIVVTANELHIPVGRAVNLTLTSDEVVHSFWVPKLAGKVDVVPTRKNELWFIADDPGNYYGQCAEFCGIAHANMRFRVIAEPEDKFNEWVANYRTAPELPAVDDPTTEGVDESLAVGGQTLFQGLGGCLTCHTTDGPPAFAQIGPNLTLFGSRTTMAAGIRENTVENLTEWLRDPSKVKPGNRMVREASVYCDHSKNTYFNCTDPDKNPFGLPDLTLSDDGIKALVAYLYSLK